MKEMFKLIVDLREGAVLDFLEIGGIWGRTVLSGSALLGRKIERVKDLVNGRSSLHAFSPTR